MFMKQLPKSGMLQSKPSMPTPEDMKLSTLSAAASTLQTETIFGTHGLTNPNQNYENRSIIHSYNLAVFHDGQESDLEEYCPVFVHRPSTQPTGTTCAIAVPHINTYLEWTVRDRQVRVRHPTDVLRKNYTNSSQFYTHTVQDFLENWNFLGSIAQKPKLASINTEGGTIKPNLNPSVAVCTAGVMTMKQMFGEQVKRSQQLFWLVKPVDSPYRNFYGMKGQIVGPKTPHGTSFLQVLGFSENETVIPYPSTASSADHDPLLFDRCGVARNQKLTDLYSIVEYDELNGYNIRPAEDIDVPDIVVDLYREGAVLPAGIVQTADPRPVSQHLRLMAHRDMETMKGLPNVTVIHSASCPY